MGGLSSCAGALRELGADGPTGVTPTQTMRDNESGHEEFQRDGEGHEQHV